MENWENLDELKQELETANMLADSPYVLRSV
jgi:hypothetical protein